MFASDPAPKTELVTPKPNVGPKTASPVDLALLDLESAAFVSRN